MWCPHNPSGVKLAEQSSALCSVHLVVCLWASWLIQPCSDGLGFQLVLASWALWSQHQWYLPVEEQAIKKKDWKVGKGGEGLGKTLLSGSNLTGIRLLWLASQENNYGYVYHCIQTKEKYLRFKRLIYLMMLFFYFRDTPELWGALLN